MNELIQNVQLPDIVLIKDFISDVQLPDIAVIPIFVNTGAAILPAIIAGLANFFNILFNPKKLYGFIKSNPLTMLLIILAGVLIYLFATGVFTPTETKSQKGRETTLMYEGSQTDWSKVAIEIIKENGRQKTVQPQFEIQPKVQVADSTTLVEGENATLITAEKQQETVVKRIKDILYRGDLARSGYLGGKSPVNLTEQWRYEEENAMFLSSPIIHNNMLFGAWTILDPPESYGGIFAIDINTGKELWLNDMLDPASQKEFKGIFSSPSVSADGKYVVIGQGLHPDSNCELLCFNTSDGSLHWKVKTPLHIESSPVIDGNIVIAGAGAIEVGNNHKAAGDPGFVFAVELSTGKQLWKYALNDPESSPVVYNGIVYIGSGFNGNAVVALRTESDKELVEKGLERLLWKKETPHPATGAITVVDGLVLVGCGNSDYVFAAKNPEGNVIAFDSKTGEQKWKLDMPDAVLGAIACKNGIAICPVRNGEVVALSIKESGKVLWRQRVTNSMPVLAAPSFTGSHVYAVSQDGYLAVLNGKDGTVLEKHYINSKSKPGSMGLSLSSPIIYNNRLFIGSETGGITCFNGVE
jgi:outer membrane protein assembly factor BamB